MSPKRAGVVAVAAMLLVVFAPCTRGQASQPGEPPAGAPRIRVGSDIESKMLLHVVSPVYPPIARTALIQGTVVLHAIIGVNGSVKELQYISGPPLLMRAAMEAVKQWKYKPYLLNGEPIEVDTTIPVRFAIGGTGALEKLQRKPDLAAKIRAQLPAGTSILDAALGYNGIRDFEDAVFTARDLSIPFAELKCAELGGMFCDPQSNSHEVSLEKAIHALKPEMSKSDVKNAVKKAKQEAKSL